MHERMSRHRGYVTRNKQDATGCHFIKLGHTLSNMSISVLERVKSLDPIYRKERKNTTSESSILSTKE